MGIEETLQEDVDLSSETTSFDVSKLDSLSKSELKTVLTNIVEGDPIEDFDSIEQTKSMQGESADNNENTQTNNDSESPTNADLSAFIDSNTDSEHNNAKNENEDKQPNKYSRPSELTVRPGSATLIKCTSDDPLKKSVRRDFVQSSKNDSRNVLLIQYQEITHDEIKTITNNSKRVKIISVGFTQTVPDSVTDSIETEVIENKSDVTRLGISATSTLSNWVELNEISVVSVDGFDTVFQEKTNEGTFRFLHIFLGKLTSKEAMSHVFIDHSIVDTQSINTIKPLFDSMLTVESPDVKINQIK